MSGPATTAVGDGGEPAATTPPPSCVGGSDGGVPAQQHSLPLLTWRNCLPYIEKVQQTFKDDKPKFDKFLKIMRDCSARGIDASTAVLKVTEIFKGHQFLITGCNAFLPVDFVIVAPHNFDQASHYLLIVMTRFAREGHMLETFLKILSKDRNEMTAIPDLYEEVVHLFAEHPDLVARFHYFLPDSTGPVFSSNSITSPAPVPNHGFPQEEERTRISKAQEHFPSHS